MWAKGAGEKSKILQQNFIWIFSKTKTSRKCFFPRRQTFRAIRFQVLQTAEIKQNLIPKSEVELFSISQVIFSKSFLL